MSPFPSLSKLLLNSTQHLHFRPNFVTLLAVPLGQKYLIKLLSIWSGLLGPRILINASSICVKPQTMEYHTTNPQLQHQQVTTTPSAHPPMSKWWPISFLLLSILFFGIGGGLLGAWSGSYCASYYYGCIGDSAEYNGGIACLAIGGILKLAFWITLILYCVRRHQSRAPPATIVYVNSPAVETGPAGKSYGFQQPQQQEIRSVLMQMDQMVLVPQPPSPTAPYTRKPLPQYPPMQQTPAVPAPVYRSEMHNGVGATSPLGEEQQMARYCSHCGSLVKTPFCSQCGAARTME